MKHLLLAIVTIFFTASTLAQGTLIFNNRTQSGDAPFSINGVPFGAFPDAHAQLYLVQPGGVLTPLTPSTTFRTTSTAAMFFIKEINPFVVDGVLAGESATVRVRVYLGDSYESAVAAGLPRGESNDVLIPQLGGTPANGAPIPTPSLNGLQGFDAFPEPSTITFGIFGAAVLLLYRRR